LLIPSTFQVSTKKRVPNKSIKKRAEMKLNSLIFLTLTTCFFTLCVTGCGKNVHPTEDFNTQNFIDRPEQITELNQKLFADANITPDRGDYLLGPGDLIEVKVFESDKLNTVVRISSRGNVSLPLLGEINLKGKTAYEAETLIEKRYKDNYIKNPHVSVFVKEHYSQRVTVVGEVNKPGTYDYPSKQRLVDALAIAGGLTEKAGQIVHVRRLNSDSDDFSQTFMINLDELINEGKTELNIGINGGDVIFVPEAGLFYVDGAVRHPGEYHIKENLSVRRALLSAGGLATYANTKDLILMRKSENGDREEIKINLQKDINLAEETIVKDGDIIFVNASFWGKLLFGGGVNIGIPGLGVSYRDPER
jgi:polysaccharide biosynthesis/export protein